MKSKDPPDKCKTLKCNLKTILRSNYDYDFLFNAIKKVNDLTFLCSHFIRSYIIYKFEKGDNIPEISKQFIKNSFKVLSKKSCGPKTKNSTGIMDDMESYFNKYFVKLTTESFSEMEDVNEYKLSAKNTSYMTALEEDSMLISYENNIKLNYEKYLRQFVNQNFKNSHQNLIDKSKNKVLLRKELKSELHYVKQDLIKGTKGSNIKYHLWIDNVRSKIIPNIKHDLETDLDKYPQKFIKYMLFMNKYLEDTGLKLFQPISLRTDVKDKYITINTNALVDILPTLKNKNDYYKRITECQSDLWNQVFNINTNKLKLKGYSFNYQIQTDGVGLSINFIKDDQVEAKKTKMKKMTEGSKKSKALYKDLSEDDKNKLKNAKNEKDIEISIKQKEKLKEIQKEKRKEFKKLSKDKQDEIKLKLKLDRDEFNYIEDLVKIDDFLTQLKKYKKDNMIGYADPGKRSPLTIMREDGEFYEYKTKRRLRETKRLKYNHLIDNKKFKTNLNGESIKKLEAELSEYSHKSVNSKKFNEYVKKKVSFKSLVKNEKTYNNYLKKLNWYMFINSKRHEDKIINEIETFIGKKGTIVIGDWGGKGNISYISTPNVGLQRRLKEKLNVYHVNEFKTSQLHHKTKEKMDNLKLGTTYKSKRQEKEIKKDIKLHSVLTFKTSQGSYGCINRDKNAVKNMKYIVEELIKTQKRPQEFTINSKTRKHGENLEKHEDLKMKKGPKKVIKKEPKKVIVKVIKNKI